MPLLLFAMDDRGSFQLEYIFILPFFVLAPLFAVITLFAWKKRYQPVDKRTNIFFMVFAPVLTLLFFGYIQFNRLKAERPYFLFAKDLLSPHDYVYYFRDDSLLKTHGVFKMSDCDFYQSFHLRGDTILLDSVLTVTNLVSKKYLKTSLKNTSGKAEKVLIPLDKKGNRMDTFILSVVEDKEFYY